MDALRMMLAKKPKIFLLVSFVYLVLVGFLKWQFHPVWDWVWYLVGGVMGVYFLDAAELFFNLNPSPFRSVVFMALFVIVGVFVITSSQSALATGLVLSLFLSLLLWQVGEWRVNGNVSTWYRMVAFSVPPQTQLIILGIFSLFFVLETYLFIH